jgi:hypothetical protein
MLARKYVCLRVKKNEEHQHRNAVLLLSNPWFWNDVCSTRKKLSSNPLLYFLTDMLQEILLSAIFTKVATIIPHQKRRSESFISHMTSKAPFVRCLTNPCKRKHCARLPESICSDEPNGYIIYTNHNGVQDDRNKTSHSKSATKSLN